MNSKAQWDANFRYIVLAFLLTVLVASLWYIREVFRPLITAALIAYFLSPAVDFLTTRARLRRKVSANVVYFVALALCITLLVTVVPFLFGEFQSVAADINRALDELQMVLEQPRQIGNARVYLGSLIPAIRATFSGVIVPQPEEALRILEVTSRNFLWLLVVLVTAYYLMTDWDRLRAWMIQLAPQNEQSGLNRLYRELRKVWLSYLRGQIRLIFILAILYSIAWFAIGLPGATALGTLAGVLNLIPEVGPFSAALFATVVALIEGSNFLPLSNLWFALLTLGIYLLLNNFKTIWLQPRILGQSVFLHEGVVFVAIIAAIILQGILGVLLVVPLLASMVVIGRYIRKRLLGLPPFAEEEPASPSELEPAAPSIMKADPKGIPPRRKTK